MDIKVDQNTVVVFDLDDTLYNELDFLKSAYIAIAQYLEPKEWITLYVSMFSMYRSNINVFDYLALDYGKDAKTLIDMYRNHSPDIELFEGVIDVIKAIKQKEGHIGIITDGRSGTQRSKIKSLNITDLIDKIVISDDIGSEKPAEENFLAIEAAFKFNEAEFYYIADNLKKDFITPNARAWKTIGLIDNGKNIHHASHQYMSPSHKPQAFIFSFKDIKIK